LRKGKKRAILLLIKGEAKQLPPFIFPNLSMTNSNKLNKKLLSLSLITIFVINFVSVQMAQAQMNSEYLLNQVNSVRAEHNLAPLQFHPLLNQAAQEKVEALFTAQRFTHDLPETPFYTFVDDQGYNYKKVGENLAIDFANEEGVINGWMNSTTHRANMINGEFTDTGIAIVSGRMQGVETTLVVQLFAKPSDSFVTHEFKAWPNPNLDLSSLNLAGFLLGSTITSTGIAMSYVNFRYLKRKKLLAKT